MADDTFSQRHFTGYIHDQRTRGTKMSFLHELRGTNDWFGAEANPPDLNRLDRYLVRDIPRRELNRTNVILLIESPHTVEVCRDHPLAGPSGVSVTAALRRILDIQDDLPDCPFGELLQPPFRNDRLRNIGVMNASQLPMQSEAYPYPIRRDFDTILFRHFKTLRDPAAIRRDNCQPIEVIKRLLITDLSNRLRRTHDEAYIVPCGDVAKAFFLKANHNIGCPHIGQDIDQGIPHPSRGRWQRHQNEDLLANLQEEIVAHLH